MLRRFGNAIFAAALLALASSDYMTTVRADAYTSAYGGDSDAVTESPPPVTASGISVVELTAKAPRSLDSGSDVGDVSISPPPQATLGVITPAPGSIINVEEEAVTAKPSTPKPAADDDDSSSSGSSELSGPTITVEEEPVTTAPKVVDPASSASSDSSLSGPTITVEEEPVVVGLDADTVGADADVGDEADRSAYAAPTPATTSGKIVASTVTGSAGIPASTPAATTTKMVVTAPVVPVATPAATTGKAPVVPAVAAVPAATPATTVAGSGATATGATVTPVPMTGVTPTVTPAKKRKDCDPQFPAEDVDGSAAVATPAPSAPKVAIVATPAPTPAKTTPASDNNGAVKASADDISDATANSYVQREQPSPSPVTTVITATTKSDESGTNSGSASLAVPMVVAAVVVGVMGVAAMRLKKRRDEDAKLSTPVEQFGELRPTPAGNTVL